MFRKYVVFSDLGRKQLAATGLQSAHMVSMTNTHTLGVSRYQFVKSKLNFIMSF